MARRSKNIYGNSRGYLLVIAFVLLFCGAMKLHARWLSKRINRPDAALIEPREQAVDLGIVHKNDVVNLVFSLRNVSASSLTLRGIDADCGCTKVDLKSGVIQAGATLSIPVSLNTSSISLGPFRKRIVVTMDLNGTLHQYPRSIIGILVQREGLAVFPGIVDFGEITGMSEVVKTVYFVGDPSILRQIPTEIPTDGETPIRLQLRSLNVSRNIDLKAVDIKFLPSAARGRICDSTIDFADASANPGRLAVRIPIRGVIVPSVVVEPASLIVDEATAEKRDSQYTIVARSVNARNLVITDVRSSVPIDWTIVRGSNKSEVEIKLHFRQFAIPRPPDELTIDCQSPEQSVRVPLIEEISKTSTMHQ